MLSLAYIDEFVYDTYASCYQSGCDKIVTYRPAHLACRSTLSWIRRNEIGFQKVEDVCFNFTDTSYITIT